MYILTLEGISQTQYAYQRVKLHPISRHVVGYLMSHINSERYNKIKLIPNQLEFMIGHTNLLITLKFYNFMASDC